MGQIVFPAPFLKIETPEMNICDSVNSILVEHSPQCQLRLQITSISSIGSTAAQNTLHHEYPTPWTFTGSSEDQQSAGNTIRFEGSQDVTPTLQDITTGDIPAVTDSESSQDITYPHGNRVTLHKPHSVSQDVTGNNYMTPSAGLYSDAPKQPDMSLETSENEPSQDVTYEPTETTAFSDPNMTENSACVLNNSDSTTNNIATKMANMADSHELTTLVYEPLAPTSQDVMPSTTLNSTGVTHDMSTMEVHNSMDNANSVGQGITPETNAALDSDDTIIIIQPDHQDQMNQSVFDNNDSSEISTTPNITPSSQHEVLNKRTKKFLASVGISEALYRANVNAYYTIYLPEEDDVEHISFLSILESSCSVSTMNLSAEQIEFEKTALRASSPIPDLTNTTDTRNIDPVESSSIGTITSPKDDEKDDPTFGTHADPKHKQKPSNRLGRVPSAAHIAAQKLVVKTKGLKPSSSLKLKLLRSSKPKPMPHQQRSDSDGNNIGDTNRESTPSVTLKPVSNTEADPEVSKPSNTKN